MKDNMLGRFWDSKNILGGKLRSGNC